MMKFLTTALGGLTILTVTGMATPPGQAMLGMRPTQAQAPVSVIADPGPATVAAPIAVPARPVPAATPVAVPQPAARPIPTHAVPAARPAVPAAAPVQAAPAANPMGGAGALTNILLNLPQVLQGTQVAPAGGVNNGGWTPPGQRARKHHDGSSDQNGDTPER